MWGVFPSGNSSKKMNNIFLDRAIQKQRNDKEGCGRCGEYFHNH
ncbi:hypothetical protein FH5_02365 [Priestia endophytica]|nr:hypothetical protein FH5_02365 [Priestia endophytica]